MGIKVGVLVACMLGIISLYGSAQRTSSVFKKLQGAMTPFFKKEAFQHPYTIFENPQSNSKTSLHFVNQPKSEKKPSIYVEASEFFGTAPRETTRLRPLSMKTPSKGSLASHDGMALPSVPGGYVENTGSKVNLTKRPLPDVPKKELNNPDPTYDSVVSNETSVPTSSNYEIVKSFPIRPSNGVYETVLNKQNNSKNLDQLKQQKEELQKKRKETREEFDKEIKKLEGQIQRLEEDNKNRKAL